MRILHCVESYYPDVGGMQEVVRQISERLVELGHEVHVATRKLQEKREAVIRGVHMHEFDIRGNRVRGIRGEKEAYENFLLNSDYDVVTFFAAQQWATDIALPILDRIRGKKVSVPTGYSGLYWPEYQGYFEDMKRWIHGYDMNVYLSNDYRDIQFAREQGVTRMVIIPNGAGEDEFLASPKHDVRKDLGLKPDTTIVLLVGSYTGVKGHSEALEIFLRSGLRNAALVMIGNNHEKFRIRYRKRLLIFLLRAWNSIAGSKKVIFRFFDRSFTVDAYRQADIFLFPSNIECSPIVLFECAASGLPFLSSNAGNAEEIASWTGGGKILPCDVDANGFSHARIAQSADMLTHLWKNKNERQTMGENAREAWRKSFSWEVIARQYEDMYKQLLHP